MSDSTKPTSAAPRPTRRGFLALLGVTAAAVAVGLPPDRDRARSPWTGPNGKQRWIGHC